MQEVVTGRNVKASVRTSFKDKLIKQCLDRAKSERMRLLAKARSQSMSEDIMASRGLDGTQLASLVRSAVSVEMSSARDSAMCTEESHQYQGQGYVDDEGLEHLSQEEYIEFMKSLEDEVFQELRVQGTHQIPCSSAYSPSASKMGVLKNWNSDVQVSHSNINPSENIAKWMFCANL